MMILMLVLQLAGFALMCYGSYLAFKKHWALGVVGVLVPGFSCVVGGAKLLFKKDILK